MPIRFVGALVLSLWGLAGCEAVPGNPSQLLEPVASTSPSIDGDASTGDETPSDDGSDDGSAGSGATTFTEVVQEPSGSVDHAEDEGSDHAEEHRADEASESPEGQDVAADREDDDGLTDEVLSDAELLALVSAGETEDGVDEETEDDRGDDTDALWEPGDELPGSWGVRLVRTLHDTHPPSAVIGLPDGTQHVVEAGAMLPEARLVVLAIGRDAVQIAEVTPLGDRARVETSLLQPLYRELPPEP